MEKGPTKISYIRKPLARRGKMALILKSDRSHVVL